MKMQSFVVAAAYHGDCCAKTHVWMAKVHATTASEAKQMVSADLKKREFTASEFIVVRADVPPRTRFTVFDES